MCLLCRASYYVYKLHFLDFNLMFDLLIYFLSCFVKITVKLVLRKIVNITIIDK